MSSEEGSSSKAAVAVAGGTAAAGVPFETETVRSMRRVARQPDGHWLVGDQVEAG